MGLVLCGHPTGLSFYECPQDFQQAALSALGSYPGLQEMQPWFQGDHMIFVMNGVPAMALTTTGFMQMETEIAHTSKDSLDKIDVSLLVEAAHFIRDLISINR